MARSFIEGVAVHTGILKIAGASSWETKLREAAAQAMFTIFARSFKQRAKGMVVEERTWWKTNVDRNVENHLTLATWAQRVGILKKQSGHARSLGVLNAEGEWYALAEYCPECVPKMLHLHSIGRLLLDTAIPETNAQRGCTLAGIKVVHLHNLMYILLTIAPGLNSGLALW